MAKKKYYAVRSGKVKGIYFTWDDCKNMVNGFKNAQYKSFENPLDAVAYIEGVNVSIDESSLNIDDNRNILDDEEDIEVNIEENIEDNTVQEKKSNNKLIAYIDGSFNIATSIYGSGGILIDGEDIVHEFSNVGKHKEWSSMRNVAGEIEASMYAISYAVNNGYKEIDIVYDYTGIEMWCIGAWKTNKDATKLYKNFYDKNSKLIKINFVKVKSHSGNFYNDIADKLAKNAAGVF